MRRALSVVLCAVSLGASSAAAHAAMISGSVAWDASLSTPKVDASRIIGPIVPPQPPAITFTDWSAWTFSDQSLPTRAKITGDLNIFALVKGEAAQWKDAPFTLTFVIHDGPGPDNLGMGVAGAITFSGVLNGALTRGADGRVTSSVAIDWLGATTKTLDLDHHLYTLSVSAYARTGTLPDPEALGAVGVDIQVRHNPEPASLVLAALALPALALAVRRRKKRLAGVVS